MAGRNALRGHSQSALNSAKSLESQSQSKLAAMLMDRQQSLDPVDVLDTFVNQPATLTMEPTVVLLGDNRHAHNAPNLRFTTQMRHQ
jgi:hypothetical protein